MIRDLERVQPRYVLREHRWYDPVPPEIQMPDLLHYIDEHYAVEHVIGQVEILRRRSP
jgi:hypothetical protein